MKARYFLFAALAFALAVACERREEPDLDDKTYEFGLAVRNQDYTESVVMNGVSLQTGIKSVDNLPPWVSGVALQETDSDGNPVALVSVKGDGDLQEARDAKVVLKMENGATVNLNLIQWPVLKDSHNAESQSLNKQFEADWASAKKIQLVISNVDVNGRSEIMKTEVSLPWNWGELPASHLPKGHDRSSDEVYKMVSSKEDWSLVFNLTGIEDSPNYNYFGLYNRYTGILRIFYYFTKDLVPTNANDHMWSFTIDGNLAEHVATQFALPRKEAAKLPFRRIAAMPILSTPTTDEYNPLSTGGQTIPGIGWWAFDVNMSVYRDHDFFSELTPASENLPLPAIDIHLRTFQESQVFLRSVLQGNIDGKLQGKMNLDQLLPYTMSTWGKWVVPIVSGVGSVMTNNYLLGVVGKIGQPNNGGAGNPGDANIRNNQLLNQQDAQPENGGALPNRPVQIIRTKSAGVAISIVMLIAGTAISYLGKYLEGEAKERVRDDDFGSLKANMNLDMNAVMSTAGQISSPTANVVPPATMTLDYLKKTNPDGSATSLGKGVWNLDAHPVVYVVNDAYWSENNFKAFDAQIAYPLDGKDVYCYYLGGTKGARPGLRLITFLDPTSVGGISFNPDLFNGAFDKVRIALSYGVYPGSNPGYTDSFREAVGLNVTHTWRLYEKEISENKALDSATDLKLIKRPHTDTLFKWVQIPDELKSVSGYRLSTQHPRSDIPALERRFYGASMFYSNPYATDFVVDQVQYVFDPQIYVPFDDVAHRLYDPQVPDLVVSAAVSAYGKDRKDTEDSAITSTLRFIPKIVFISYKDLPTIAKQIKKRLDDGEIDGPKDVEVIWESMVAQVNHIGDIAKAVQ